MPRPRKNKSIKTRSGVSLRWRNGRLNVQVRLKGFPPRSQTFPEGTTAEQGREWGLAAARNLKLRDVPTLAHKVLSELTTEGLIKEYQREVQLAVTVSKMNHAPAYVRGYVLKRSWENENIIFDALLEREPRLCAKPLGQVTTQDFEDYRDRRLASGIKPATLRRELKSALSYIYKLARRKYKISFDPLKDLILPKEDEGRERTMSDDERTRILKAAENCRTEKQQRLWIALIVAALTSAARGGELLKLQCGDIDFERDTLYFKAKNTKSGRARLIPMSKSLRDNLTSYLHLLPKDDKTPTSRVFPLTHSAKEQGWRRLCRRAEPPIKDLHFHDLRHTAATRFDNLDLSSSENEYMLGHSGGSTNSKYVHAEIERIRAKLDADYKSGIPEFELPFVKKFLSKKEKEHQERLAKDKVEKVAVFGVKDDNTRLAPLGYYTKQYAYKLMSVDVEYHPHLPSKRGFYILKNNLGLKYLVIDPEIVNVKKTLIEDLHINEQSSQTALEDLNEATAAIHGSHTATPPILSH